MGIKKFSNIFNEKEVKIKIGKDEGLFLVKKTDGSNDCIHMTEVSGDEDYFKGHNDTSECKYIGSEKLFRRIVNKNGVFEEKTVRVVKISRNIEVVYFPNEGRVQIPKNRSDALYSDEKKKVLIVEDSKPVQMLLKKIINQSNHLEVMKVTSCPSEAKAAIEYERPDIITLDIHMPEMNGVDFLKTYLRQTGIPVVMISSVNINEGPLVMEALSNGASTYIQKPQLANVDFAAQDIRNKLETLSKKGVIRSTRGEKVLEKFLDQDGLVAVGSSTGGTHALQVVLSSLPDEIPPIVIVQHIPPVFSKALADRLNKFCRFTVKEAEADEIIFKNTVYIAPGGRQMKVVTRGDVKKIKITDDPAVNRFKPSVDYLFKSLATIKTKKLVGVILTGMGSDGAQGLLEIKNQGAYTISQDEESSVVYGMPQEAFEIGASLKVVSLEEMSSTIVRSYNSIKETE